jgi:hypothetical protein
MITQITRQFYFSFQSMLQSKLYRFRRRSLWRYLLAVGLLSLAKPDLLGSFWPTLLALAAGLVTLGLSVIVLSSYWQRNRAPFVAEVTFRADQLLVRRTLDAPAEIQDWSWVRHFGETGRYFFLEVRPLPRQPLLLDKRGLTTDALSHHPARPFIDGLLLDKQKLAADEVDALRRWVASRPAA